MTVKLQCGVTTTLCTRVFFLVFCVCATHLDGSVAANPVYGLLPACACLFVNTLKPKFSILQNKNPANNPKTLDP